MSSSQNFFVKLLIFLQFDGFSQSVFDGATRNVVRWRPATAGFPRYPASRGARFAGRSASAHSTFNIGCRSRSGFGPIYVRWFFYFFCIAFLIIRYFFFEIFWNNKRFQDTLKFNYIFQQITEILKLNETGIKMCSIKKKIIKYYFL